MKEVVTMATKKTVVEMFEEIKALCKTDEQKAFIDKRIEITKKKNASGKGETAKPTKAQIENEGIKNTILAILTTTPTTIGDLMKANAELGGFSNQKISALLTQLLTAHKVVRTEVKGKAFYALPSIED